MLCRSRPPRRTSPRACRRLPIIGAATVGMSDDALAARIAGRRHRHPGRPARPHRAQPAAGLRAQAGAGADRPSSAIPTPRASTPSTIASSMPCRSAGRERRLHDASACSACRRRFLVLCRRRTMRRNRRRRPLTAGAVTFGSFNNLAKLAAYGRRRGPRCCAGCPNAQLLIKAMPSDAARRALYAAHLTEHGIAAARRAHRLPRLPARIISQQYRRSRYRARSVSL